MQKIPFQVNEGGLVALLPNGHVEFLAASAEPLIHRHNGGSPVPAEELMTYALSDPLVTLDRFHLPAPAIAFVETTNLCNLRCRHCYADSALKRPDEMSTPVITSLLDDFADAGVLQVFLTGGEIFSHRDAVEIIRHARSKPFSTQIFTNGLLVTEEKLAAIPPGQSFFISFDTADPERTVRGRMDFPKLKRAFEAMRAHGHVFRTAISVHRQNIQDAEEIFDWCARNGYPRPQWLETHPVGRALLHPDMLLRPGDLDEVFAVYRRCMDRYSGEPEDASGPAGPPAPGGPDAPPRGGPPTRSAGWTPSSSASASNAPSARRSAAARWSTSTAAATSTRAATACPASSTGPATSPGSRSPRSGRTASTPSATSASRTTPCAAPAPSRGRTSGASSAARRWPATSPATRRAAGPPSTSRSSPCGPAATGANAGSGVCA